MTVEFLLGKSPVSEGLKYRTGTIVMNRSKNLILEGDQIFSNSNEYINTEIK